MCEMTWTNVRGAISPLYARLRTDQVTVEALLRPSASSETNDAMITDLDDLIETLDESIRTLFKTSGIARRAITRDRYALALRTIPASQVIDESVDFERIGDLFPRLRQSKQEALRTILAKANNQRRRYLKYCGDHQASLLADTPAIEEAAETIEPALFDETSSQAAKSTATTVHATHVDLVDTEVDDSGSIISAFSYATDSANPMRYRVADLEAVNGGYEYFICPYCRKEQCFTSQARWKKHVLTDIKAYGCLQEECTGKLLDNSRAWMDHQLDTHLTQRICPYCDPEWTFSSVHEFETHLRQRHAPHLQEEQLLHIRKACERKPVEIPTSACPFCDWQTKLEYQSGGSSLTVSLQRYRRHVCSHLEQAALVVLNVEEPQDSEDDAHGSNEAPASSSNEDDTSLRHEDETTAFEEPLTGGFMLELALQQDASNPAADTSRRLRPFVCTLAPYGCSLTFDSKIEWQRHINIEHVRSSYWRRPYWRCDECDQGKKPNDFRRQDTFVRHFRVMHPVGLPAAEGQVAKDQVLGAIADRCKHVRTPPPRSGCPFCDAVFEILGDKKVWNERLEHIAEHMEADRYAPLIPDPRDWTVDLDFERWLLQEGLIKSVPGGIYKLA